MMTAEIQSIRNRFAGYDMTKARKEGEIIIAQTKVGNLFVSYDASTKTYRAASAIGTPVEGKANIVKPFIASQYVIEASC